ncbi:hypothetical protein HT102_01655 [Hoyosella sp. G463]|uniref:SMP-30/Gluconolactonase/LRE-like region domain-containing protein n=1 Tax=Lolliginicoccus lacisalsi TaxID=2742202 RepID=A0A927J9K0_9ACTN|nr:hypothetical protein [Lolliginicoccus lacisalsi]MBD8505196.1 hypothetical protein [Lolliginicoccus lacisalsi]
MNVPRGLPALLALACALALSGCGDQQGSPNVPTVPPATPAAAPAQDAAEDLDIVPLASAVHGIEWDPATGATILLAEQAVLITRELATAPTDAPPPGLEQIDLPASPTALALDGAGTAYVTAGPAVLAIDLNDPRPREIARLEGGADLVSITLVADDVLAAGTSDGAIHVLDPASEGISLEEPRITGLVGTDVLVSVGGSIAALDRRQSKITEVLLARDTVGFALRAGNGASTMVADPRGRVLVANTRDGELLVYSLDRLILRQRYPVPDSPHGIAYDAQEDLAWVTQTGRNEIAAYTLDTGIPVEVARYATVRQPDSVTIDSDNGFVYIASATGDGIQRIRASDAR